jgi:circadian clock protein KaiC
MSLDAAPAGEAHLQRVSTGVAGLDNVLNGGLPSGHLYLVEGEPGSGKTTLGLQFLRAGVAHGETALYVTLSETKLELQLVAQSHGWSLDGIQIFELSSPERVDADAEQSVLHPSELELGETTDDILRHVASLEPDRVVFDSLSEMRLLAQDPLRYRRQILALKHFFARHRCTVLMLDDRSSGAGDLQLHSIAHGVLTLAQTQGDYGEPKRSLRVGKLRGSTFRGGEHDFRLTTGGLVVYPRLIAAEHRTGFVPTTKPTGSPALDDMFGGGLGFGTSTLLLGPSGVGKTTTALWCVATALQRGECATYYLFDEGLDTVLARARALGVGIEPYLASKQLEIVQFDPASVSPGEFATHVQHAVQHRGVTLVGVDSVNAYLKAMTDSKALLLQMHELLLYLNQRGVATMLVLSQHGLFGEEKNEVDLSYLSDAILLFKYFEARGQLRKALAVIKSRISRHELTIREFQLSAEGLRIGASLMDFEGVMRGVTAYRGQQPLLDGAVQKAL